MSSGNLSAYIARMARLNANLVSGDGNSTVLNNSTNSGPSVGSSSLVTDANSPLVGTSHFHSGGSTNMDSYLTLPSSPLSFSSTNFSTLVIDASSKEQPTCSHRDQNSQVGDKRLCPQLQIGGTATSQTTSQAQRGSHHTGKRKEPGIAQMSKKPRLDRNQENILHQKIIQQLLQKQDTMAIQDHNQLLQALMQQHKLQNQQQQYIRNSVPQFVGIPIQQQQQQPKRHHLQQQVNLQIPAVQPYDAGICSRRLMQYVYHPRKETTGQAKKMHETEWLASPAVSPGSSNTMNEKSDVKDGITTGSEKAGLAVKQERSCSINSSTQTGISLPLPFLGPQSSSPRVIQSPPVSDLSTSQLPQDGDDEHHRTIQNILQQMVYNSRAKWVQSVNTKVKEEVLEELDGNQVGKLSTRACAPANVLGSTLGRSDYFDTGSNSSFSRIYGENAIVKREADILGRFQLPESVQDMDYEFFKNGVLNDDRKWKA